MRAGSAVIIGDKGKILGIFTDGDLRRHFESGKDFSVQKISKIMTRSPITIKEGKLAAEAFEILRSKKIDEIPVVDAKGQLVGILDVQDILKAGLV